MARYLKNCAVDGKPFYSSRINTVFCSQHCRNKARTFPANILQAMIEKSNRTVQVMPTVPKAVKEFIRIHGKSVELHTPNKGDPNIDGNEKLLKDELDLWNINREDQVAMIEKAKEIVHKTEREKIKHQRRGGFNVDTVEDSSGSVDVPLNIGVVLPKGISKDLVDPEALALQEQLNNDCYDNNTNTNPQQIEKKYKIRKIGG